MATEITVGLLRDAYPIEASASKKVSNIVMEAEKDFRVYGGSDSISFVLMGVELTTATGEISAYISIGCNDATGWTDLYSTAAGKAAFLTLHVTNYGASAGVFSCGSTVTEVAGESPPA